MTLIEGFLVPLSLPTGWVVLLNNWFYRDSILPNGEENPLFVRDIILLKLARFEPHLQQSNGHFSRDFYLDLYWQGGAKTGTYILRFYEGATVQMPLACFASSNALQIQSKINEWLDLWSKEEFPSCPVSNQ